ncbi:unnamed protein product, partial [Phaeothamnion confervicola]
VEFLKPPKTVEELDVSKYLGTWYQVYASLSVLRTFEKNGYCIKAEYTSRENDTIGVDNSQRLGGPDGNVTHATGYAYRPYDKAPGKLKVHFDEPRVPVDGSYWVLLLGNDTDDGQYSFSVVSDPLRAMLFVLVRDPEQFTESGDEECVLAFLKKAGFVLPWNKPVATPHDDCPCDGADGADFGGGSYGNGGTSYLNSGDGDYAYYNIGFPLHASCRGVVWDFPEDDCETVGEALVAAAAAMRGFDGCGDGEKCGYDVMQDPSDDGALVGTHETPKAHYVDDLHVKLQPRGDGGCRTMASSVSRTFYAILDQGTNYCSLSNWAEAAGLTYEESGVSDDNCTQYSTADCGKY